MTLVARKLRLTTQREIEDATRLQQTRLFECEKLGERIREMEEAHPRLCGLPEAGEEEMPEGLQAVYDKQVFRYDQLSRFLMEYPATLQTALQKQQDTRNKAGELVSSLSVGIFIQRIMAVAKRYVPAAYAGRFDQEAEEVYLDFLRQNPAALLSKAGKDREEEDEDDQD